MEISRCSVPDSMSVSSNPFRQDQGAHHQEGVIEDGAPEHGGKNGYRGIGQEISIIKAEHQLCHATSARRRTQNRNHPHHPLSAPSHQHVALTMEGNENSYHDGESRQPRQGSITHQLQPEFSALQLCLLRSHRHLLGKLLYLGQESAKERNLAASLQYPTQNLRTMQQQEVEDAVQTATIRVLTMKITCTPPLIHSFVASTEIPTPSAKLNKRCDGTQK